MNFLSISNNSLQPTKTTFDKCVTAINAIQCRMKYMEMLFEENYFKTLEFQQWAALRREYIAMANPYILKNQDRLLAIWNEDMEIHYDDFSEDQESYFDELPPLLSNFIKQKNQNFDDILLGFKAELFRELECYYNMSIDQREYNFKSDEERAERFETLDLLDKYQELRSAALNLARLESLNLKLDFKLTPGLRSARKDFLNFAFELFYKINP